LAQTNNRVYLIDRQKGQGKQGHPQILYLTEKAGTEIVNACQLWVAASSILNRCVRVELPLEVGSNFVARTHFTCYVSTDSYTLDEFSDEPPNELAELRTEVNRLKQIPADTRMKIIHSIMFRSSLEPTAKAFSTVTK